MANINAPILPQKFEQIRDQIALIIATELANQATLQGEAIFNAVVWTERFIPTDSTETPQIVVNYDSANFSDETPESNLAEHEYQIDILTQGTRQAGDAGGDKDSALKAQRLAGVVFAILQSPYYVVLGFPLNFGIRNRQVTNLQVANSGSKQDVKHTYVARLTLSVKVAEEVFPIAVSPAEGYDSQALIEETDEGYKVVINN